jgi:hypothetical protein
MGIATLLAFSSIPAQATDDNLVYVAVEPCRLADTRTSEGGTGPIGINSFKYFQVYGSDLSGQGGNAGGCAHPRAGTGVEPLAISAYVVAVPTPISGPGNLTAYPSDQSPPSNTIATVNWGAGQVIGNTTNVKLCQPGSCPSGGQMAIIAFSSEQNVVIDVQGYYYPAAGSCSDDMVPVGSVCVDKYEASLVDSGGTPTTAAACNVDGSDCGGVIFAQSIETGAPAYSVSWYQAAQACANVGKRLPTTAEWQMAAAGTPGGAGNGCNLASGAAPTTTTGASSACISTTGAIDMVGNLWEWAAELDSNATGFTTTDGTKARALGASWAATTNSTNTTTQALDIITTGPTTISSRRGFRCVR